MARAPLEIIACPSHRRAEAIALVLCDIAPSQRRELARAVCNDPNDSLSAGGLIVALDGQRLAGAVWAQRQPGNTAMFWPPQLVPGEDEPVAYRLAEAATRELHRAQVAMAQVLLPSHDDRRAGVLTHVGFQHLADLAYLSCERERFAQRSPEPCALEFLPYDDSQRDRLARLIERTYDGTLDCAALNGKRSSEEVIEGYRATGEFCAQNWLIVCSAGHDVGVLLLADHCATRYWELVYMGLVPEARGQGWGRQILQQGQSLAWHADVQRIVLAVDAANEPALRTYRSAGFEAWDRRVVYVCFCR